jgi:hypothetical protein
MKLKTYGKFYAEVLESVAKEYIPLVITKEYIPLAGVKLCKHSISLQNYMYNKE